MSFGGAISRRKSGSIEPDELRLSVTRGTSATLVTVAGRITMESSPYLRRLLLRLLKERQSAAIDIDIAKVTYLDTSGIATIMEAVKLSHSIGMKLRLVGVSGQPRILADITELAAIFAAAGSEVVFS
jgi:anti-sigma B factor antagonist